MTVPWPVQTPEDPVISGIWPGSDPAGYSGYIGIYGNYLSGPGDGNVSATLGGVPVSVTYVSDGQVNISYPASAVPAGGNYSVQVHTTWGFSNTATFTANGGDATPTISSVSPISWSYNQSNPITISGSGFGTSPGVQLSYPDGYIEWASVTNANDTTIWATATHNSLVSGHIGVVAYTGQSPASTTTDAHWFALPNVACPTTANVPAYYNSAYTIKGTVGFVGGQSVSQSTTLTVNSYWNPAGLVDPNVATISGSATIALDPIAMVWRVTGMGSLARVVPTTATMNVPASSQFYNKTLMHEQYHITQWQPGNLLGDLMNPADYYATISGLTSNTQNGLLIQIANQLLVYRTAQAATFQSRYHTVEAQAYAVSDPLAPQYVYQNCGQFQ